MFVGMTEPRPPKGLGRKVIARWSMYAIGVMVFVALAVSARGPDGLFCDRPLIETSQSIAGPKLTWFATAITTLGNAPVLTGIVILVAVVLFVLKDRRSAWFVLATGAGTSLLNDLVKLLFARPRPEEILRLADASGYSFPSGHAMASASIYGAIALVLASFYPRMRLPIAIGAVVLVFAIGMSRVYLCVHYSSDVMAGWILGAALPFWFWPLFGIRNRKRET
jgi:undecaprenyl-diphosphatase